MISNQEFINQSLETNLFFLRIMKEHSIFLEAAFSIKDQNLIAQADYFKNQFTNLLTNAISISNGVIPARVLNSNEIVTKYTMDAERATQSVSGIYIDSNITSMENSLSANTNNNSNNNIAMLTDYVSRLNQYSIELTSMLIKFKTDLRDNVLSCKIFTTAYPLLIDHILREAILFRETLTKLQSGISISAENDKDILEQETFWNRIMSEHSYFIRGLLDPTEAELFDIANNFGQEFETLREESSTADNISSTLSDLTNTTLDETIKLRDFKTQGTEGLLGCKIKSIIVPLLGDHVLREANHYINLLQLFNNLS
ncbi:DUF2935 domain-containing protein [Clostridium cibarium]|uniref:DUF2935 domain-containing protein n=1 Tax=Clostridium cibarium TaxID=2762247 RepID=A0ABR8PWH0_9CLOT|nr:DUF2935 domain-containing protein [Clostridium cibarium]MBD7912530.1 DUF2935 domain-containing protein [Clostridium cibarium]